MREWWRKIQLNIFFYLIFSTVLFSTLLFNEYQLVKGIIAVFCAVIFLSISLFRNSKYTFSYPVLLMLILISYVFIRIYSSPYHPDFIYLLVMCSPVLFMMPLLADIPVKKLLFSVNLLAFISSLYGLAQFAAGITRPYSFFGNPIFFGEFLMLLMPLLIISLFFTERMKPFVIVNILLLPAAVLTASSRGVFISFAVSVIFLIYYLKKAGYFSFLRLPLKKYSLYILVPLISIFLIPGFINSFKLNIERSARLFSLKSPDIAGRVLISLTGMKMVSDKPLFGHGPGAIAYLYEKYQAPLLSSGSFRFVKTSYIHNDYIQTAAETGITGLFLYISFIISLLIFYDRKRRSLGDKTDIFCLGLAASLTGFITESFFNFPLYIFPSAALFWIFSGILYSKCSAGRDAADKTLPAVYRIPLLLALIPAVSVLLSGNNSFIQDFYIKYSMNQAVKETNYERKLLPYAYSLNTSDTRPCFLLGLSYIRSEEYEKSLFWYQKALDARPFSADTLYNIATLNRHLGNYPEAERYYEKAIALHPLFINAYQGLGRVYMDTGREEKGIEMFSKAKEILPGYFDIEPNNLIMELKETTYLIFDTGPRPGTESPK